MSISLSLTVNGKPVEAEIDPRMLLVQFIREHMGLTGTHVGCDTGQCGACTIFVDGNAVQAVMEPERFDLDALSRTLEALVPAPPR